MTNTLTTGEKNGCIYTLCFKTFVFDRGFELGAGRIFQIRFSGLAFWPNDNIVTFCLCDYRFSGVDMAVYMGFWRQTNVRIRKQTS